MTLGVSEGVELDIKTIYAGGRVTKALGEVSDRNGVPIGRIEGYFASWKLEDGPYPDRILPGAFAASIAEHKARGNRQVRVNWMHNRSPIGGAPIETVREDERGLYGITEINLSTQRGAEGYALAKQGVIVDFSVGIDPQARSFEKTPDGIEVRVLSKVRLYETSLVDEPMNRDAQVTSVKAAMPFANLPTAPEGTRWDAEAARERVLDLKLRDGDPTSAFLDRGRRWQIADVIDGALMVVPEAVEAALVDVKAEGVEDHELLTHLDRYCGRIGLASPFPETQVDAPFRLDVVKAWGPADIEQALADTGRFSRSAAKLLASRLAGPVEKSDEAVWSDVLSRLRGAQEALDRR